MKRKKLMPTAPVKRTDRPRRNWHLLEFTSSLTLRIPHGPKKTAAQTRKVIETTLLIEGYSREELARIVAAGVEAFTWSKD